MRHRAGHGRWWRRGWIAAAVLVIDHASKQLAPVYLAGSKSVVLAPFFELTLAYNTGAAFSLLSDAGGWQNGFFVIVGAIASIALLVMLQRATSHERQMEIALWLILGGALGNLANRLLYGHVIDFLHLYYGSWHWPIFNLADVAISIGALLLVLDTLGIRMRRTTAPARNSP